MGACLGCMFEGEDDQGLRERAREQVVYSGLFISHDFPFSLDSLYFLSILLDLKSPLPLIPRHTHNIFQLHAVQAAV